MGGVTGLTGWGSNSLRGSAFPVFLKGMFGSDLEEYITLEWVRAHDSLSSSSCASRCIATSMDFLNRT